MKKKGPDYRKIYHDLIIMKCPQNLDRCSSILMKEELSSLDVIKLNKIISDKEDLGSSIFNQRLKSYHVSDILEILSYQKKNGLNNSELARHFKLSRNTLTHWKRKVDFKIT
ncbi:helix-turn-helix domain-containing protein [Chryseobacterium viscerum]|uniref:Helix-turn-helix domain-containing protein n=1 Tax=Chryseobacterium viscerum TaxID=1037377 RepID=A0A5N4BML1_9FLAO|nr:helix-turn-helix domain-containing protein [Chryseobacterium viscerum]KAB1229648.1 helix-turn-helix domain-containing protein [Chryseobacterium viscerum]